MALAGCERAVHNLQLARISCWNCSSTWGVPNQTKNAEMRDGDRVGSKFCTLDYDRLRDSRVSELSINHFASLTVIHHKAETQPNIATATTVKYAKMRSRFRMVSLLTVEPEGVVSVTLSMAPLLRSNYAGWASTVANWFDVSAKPTIL
jgi:hypothetical protein